MTRMQSGNINYTEKIKAEKMYVTLKLEMFTVGITNTVWKIKIKQA